VSTPLQRVGLLARTARHLRARQLLHLALRRVRPEPTPAPVNVSWSPDRAARAGAALVALGPVSGAAEAERVARAWLERRVEVLGLDVPWQGDWRMHGPSPLWRYHLHYHEQLADVAWLAARDGDSSALDRLVEDLDAWTDTWGAGGAPAWDAYPVSVRIGSWLRIHAWTGAQLPARTRERLEQGIATHLDVLAQRLEWHLDGNHLLRNAWALALGASFLSGPWAARTSTRARRLFAALMREQVLADGWHVERSPMYHVRVLRDALELEAVARATGAPLDVETQESVRRMEAALPWMLRADGTLWLLNDAAQDHGVALGPLLGATPARATVAAPAPLAGVRHFAAAGAVVAADGGDRLRMDVGAPAPAHQPAHAHAGALGFELDLDGVPCIVDRGCSGYDGDPWRAYFRGTAAHNTVMLDGEDQSELWATFRMGGRASVTVQQCSGDARDLVVRADCRAFGTRANVHARTLERRGRRVIITDAVTGPARARVESFVHFAAEWEATAPSAHTILLERDGRRVRLTLDGPVTASLHRAELSPRCGWQAERFNTVLPAWTLRLVATGPQPRWTVTVDPG
jgi:uncharacterized heparinase superfamily protein